jgi:GAF domain-containing protein
MEPRLLEELQRTVASLRTLFDAAACSCALVDDDDGATMRFTAADGIGADLIVGVTLPVTRGIAGWAVMSGEAISVSDVARDARFARDVAEATNYVPRTVLAAPLEHRGEIAGVLEVLDPRSGGTDTGHDLAVLGVVAAQVAALLQLVDERPADRLDELVTEVKAGSPELRRLTEGVLGEIVRSGQGADRCAWPPCRGR